MRLLATAIPIVFCLALLSNSGLGARRRGWLGFDKGLRWIAAAGGVALIYCSVVFGRADWQLEKGHAFIREQRREAALPYVRNAIEMDPSNPDPVRALGWILRRNGESEFIPAFMQVDFHQQALDAYDEVIWMLPWDWDAHIAAGNCAVFVVWAGQGGVNGLSWNDARRYFERAIELAPTKYEPREEYALFQVSRARAYLQEGQLEESKRELSEAIAGLEKVPDYWGGGRPRRQRAIAALKEAKEFAAQLGLDLN